MISSEGEVIILEDVIDTAAARGQVEKWLLELEIDMKKSVKAQVSHTHIHMSFLLRNQINHEIGIDNYTLTLFILLQVIHAKDAFPTKARSWWALDWPGQTILCISKMYWTAHITDKFSEGIEGLKEYVETCTHELNEIVKLVRGTLSKQNRTTLGECRVQRRKFSRSRRSAYIDRLQ